MKDKNDVQIKAGDIVKIEGAFFKNDNGLYYVEQDGTNKAYCGGDSLTLYKICKNGKLSTTKHNICFFPIHSTVSDYVKAAQANAWNKEHATIEVVYNFDNSNVIERFEEEARRAKEASDYYKLREYSESYTKCYDYSFEYYHAAAERMKAAKDQPTASGEPQQAPKKEEIKEIKSKYTYNIKKDVDTRDNSVIYCVKIVEKLDRDEYKQINNYMRELGGYYSKYKHAFIFREDPSSQLQPAESEKEDVQPEELENVEKIDKKTEVPQPEPLGI